MMGQVLVLDNYCIIPSMVIDRLAAMNKFKVDVKMVVNCLKLVFWTSPKDLAFS